MMAYYGNKIVTLSTVCGEYFVTIGERLKQERERLKLSQPAMADAAGTTKKTQIDYEKNKTPPKGTYLAKVAALGVDVGYVITGVRAENVAHTPIEMGYLRQCRLLATRHLEDQGLKGLVFLRESNGISLEDMPEVYLQPPMANDPPKGNEDEILLDLENAFDPPPNGYERVTLDLSIGPHSNSVHTKKSEGGGK